MNKPVRNIRRVGKLIALAFGGAALVVTCFGLQRPDTARLDHALQLEAHPSATGRVQVIVTAAEGHTAAEVAAISRRHGGEVVSELPLVHAVTVVTPRRALAALGREPAVRAVSFDASVKGAASETNQWTSLLPQTPLYKSLGINDLSLMGDTIGVAVIDTGIVGGTAGNVTKFFDFTVSATKVASVNPYDDNGHGTHVSGLMGDAGVQSYGNVGGVSPNVRLIGMKVLDAAGQGRTSDVIRALDYAVRNRTALGIDIINLSLGHPIFEPADTDPLVQAVQQTVAAGIVVVVAVGNEGSDRAGVVGYAGVLSPGNAPSAITVGAVDTMGTVSRADDRIASYSSRGPTWYDGFPKPDLVAPGRKLLSTAASASRLYTDYPSKLILFQNPKSGTGSKVSAPSQYISLSGTSMATAVVSGAIARLMQAHRLTYTTLSDTKWAPSRLKPNLVKAILMYTATLVSPDGEEADVLSQGAGELNAAGAVALARIIDTSVAVDQPWLRGVVTPSTSFAGETQPWTQRIVWGHRVIWGSSVPLDTNANVWSNRVVWGHRLVWGNTADADSEMPAVPGDPVSWGRRIVMGERLLWGSRLVWGNGNGWAWGTRLVWGNTMIDASDESAIVYNPLTSVLDGAQSTTTSRVTFTVD